MPKIVTTKEFVKKANIVHNNFYNYSDSLYKSYYTKVIIICPIHGKFLQRADNHIRNKQGCPECKFVKVAKMQSSTITKFVKKANIIHKNKYDYIKSKYINNHTNIIINCPIHGDFNQRPGNHLNGQGCSQCGKIKASKKQLQSLDEFIKKSNIVHKNKYTYEKVIYKNSKNKVIIKCNDHGYFEQSPNNHLSFGCVACGIKKRANTKRTSLNTFIERSNNLHNFKYDYSLITEISSDINVSIMCPKHGVFSQSYRAHIRGTGCPLCGRAQALQNGAYINDKDTSIIYVLKMSEKNGSVFYKIGYTAHSVKLRYSQKKDMPYDYEILYENPYKRDYAINLEQLIHSIYHKKGYHYTPLNKFGGSYSECYTEIPNINKILNKENN